MCTSQKKETGIMVINRYNSFIVFHYYQFTDPDIKTNEAIQVNEAYGAQDNTDTTVQDTNTPV